MELCVLPNIEDEELKKRALDELPASGQGKTITTGEMKFVPSKAIPLKIDESYSVNVRLIDCVGYIVDDAKGYMEDGKINKCTFTNSDRTNYTEIAITITPMTNLTNNIYNVHYILYLPLNAYAMGLENMTIINRTCYEESYPF